MRRELALTIALVTLCGIGCGSASSGDAAVDPDVDADVDGGTDADADSDGAADADVDIASSDGTSWSALPTPSRFVRGLEWRGVLYAGSSDRTSSGAAGVWRLDGQSTQIPEQYVKVTLDWACAREPARWAARG